MREVNPHPSSPTDPETEHLVDGLYSIEDLVDINRLRSLFEEFSNATGFTTGFVSFPDQKLLITTGWRPICTKFHRDCPASAEFCKESNIHLTRCLKELKELSIMPCGNGLVDGATPVIIRGKHVASLATGQVLLEKPDRERFIRQARMYGYDEKAYLDALDHVPIVSEEKLRCALAYLSNLAVLIAEQGLANLRLRESTEALRREKERVRETRDVLANILDTVPQAIFWKNNEGVYQACNESFANFQNMHATQIVGRTDFDLPATPRKDAEAYRADDIATIRSGLPKRNIVEEVQTADGRRIWVETTKIPFKDAEGRPRGVLGVFDDITERKAAQELLENAKRLADSANSAKSEFLSHMSHEIRAPLNGVIGYCSLLGATSLSAEQLDYVKSISVSGDNLLRIINTLLDFSKIEAGKIEFESLDIDPRLLVSEVCQIFMPAAKSKGLQFGCTFENDLPQVVRGDPVRLKQILTNLVGNAVKFTPAGSIKVSATAQGRDLVLTVRDTGIGIAPDALGKIFEPFMQAEASHTRTFGGTGLGLVICKRLANLMGGDVHVQSVPGAGSEFTCRIPLVKQP